MLLIDFELSPVGGLSCVAQLRVEAGLAEPGVMDDDSAVDLLNHVSFKS